MKFTSQISFQQYIATAIIIVIIIIITIIIIINFHDRWSLQNSGRPISVKKEREEQELKDRYLTTPIPLLLSHFLSHPSVFRCRLSSVVAFIALFA